MPKVAICPTVTAYDTHEYRAEMERLESFAERIHIDLMDGQFAPHSSPNLNQIWWPPEIVTDLHLMYTSPQDYVEQIIKLKPNLVIIHFESRVNHQEFTRQLHEADIKTGLALMQLTDVNQAVDALPHYDDVMVYSGNLGEHGGKADMQLLEKVRQLRDRYPEIEISWDGGINYENAPQLIEAGVNVLNVGGYIQNADDPKEAYAKLKTLT
jgi:ribulose-phosphate 3-epimerase